jgi:hypothetical protein
MIDLKKKLTVGLLFVIFFLSANLKFQPTEAQIHYQYKEIGPYEGDQEGQKIVYQDEVTIAPSGIVIYRYQWPDIAMRDGYSRYLNIGIDSSENLIVILTNSSGHDEFQINRDYTDIHPSNKIDQDSTPPDYDLSANGNTPQIIYNIIINNDIINSNCNISSSRQVDFSGNQAEISSYHYIILACCFTILVGCMIWIYWKKKILRGDQI